MFCTKVHYSQLKNSTSAWWEVALFRNGFQQLQEIIFNRSFSSSSLFLGAKSCFVAFGSSTLWSQAHKIQDRLLQGRTPNVPNATEYSRRKVRAMLFWEKTRRAKTRTYSFLEVKRRRQSHIDNNYLFFAQQMKEVDGALATVMQSSDTKEKDE